MFESTTHISHTCETRVHRFELTTFVPEASTLPIWEAEVYKLGLHLRVMLDLMNYGSREIPITESMSTRQFFYYSFSREVRN